MVILLSLQLSPLLLYFVCATVSRCACASIPFALEGRFFKKTDTGLKESLKKESIASYEAADGQGSGDGKVRVDKTYRDPGSDGLKHFLPSSVDDLPRTVYDLFSSGYDLCINGYDLSSEVYDLSCTGYDLPNNCYDLSSNVTTCPVVVTMVDVIACLRRIWLGWVSCSLFPI